MSDYCTRPNRRRRLGVALIRAMVGLWRGFWNRAANARQKLTTQLLGSQSLSVSKHQSFHCAGLTDPQVHGHVCSATHALCFASSHTLQFISSIIIIFFLFFFFFFFSDNPIESFFSLENMRECRP